MASYSHQLKRFSVPLFLLIVGSISGCNDNNDDSKNQTNTTAQPYEFVEGTIEKMQTSIKTGGVTCHQVVQGYIDRIHSYDKQGPTLNSVITISETALNEADRLDTYFKQTGKLIGPMHCVTVLPKDNIDTFDMPTSAGSKALMYSQPEQDAYIIKKIRDAGGIIVGKANLDEFAFSFQGNGTHPRGGQVKNSYELSKGPGGSSSGTGASIAASFAQVGIGTDTGGSVRIPSSVEALFGLRPSLRLVSQSGIIPLAPFQDTAGPMCRTVQDCAILMDQMVGYDANTSANQRASFDINAPAINGSIAYQTMTNIPSSYTQFLNKDALKGAHIGVVRALFGTTNSTEVQLVNSTIENAINQLKAAGAIVEDVTIEDLNTILSNYRSVSAFEFKSSLNKYLQSWPNTKDNHYQSYDEILASGEARSNFNDYNIDLNSENVMEIYQKNTEERPNFVRTRLNNALDNKTLDGISKGVAYDVLLYPTIQGLPSVLGGSPTTGTNNRLSSFSGFPAMNLPAGMVTTDLNLQHVPVGMEILGREFAEPTLFEIAYAWQQYARPRQAPLNTPEFRKVS